MRLSSTKTYAYPDEIVEVAERVASHITPALENAGYTKGRRMLRNRSGSLSEKRRFYFRRLITV